MFRPILFNYSQIALIRKINQYQALKNRALISTVGYCHGLTILWLVKMREQNVKWFYNAIKDIIENDPQDYDEVEFEKFLARIEWGQNPISSGLNITQRHVSDLFCMRPSDIKYKKSVTLYAELSKSISRHVDPSMYLITNENHAVGVFQCGDSYQVYDANYKTGCAEVFYNKEIAAKEIVTRLYLLREVLDGEFDIRIHYIQLTDLSHQEVISIPEQPLFLDEDHEMQDDVSGSYRCTIL